MNRFDRGYVTRREADILLGGITVRFNRPEWLGDFPTTNYFELRQLFNRLRGATIRIRQYNSRGEEAYESGEFIVTKFDKFKDNFYLYDAEVRREGGSLVTALANSIRGDDNGFYGWIPAITDYRGYTQIVIARRVAAPEGGYTQEFREGITNCLLKPISAWVEGLGESKVKKAAQNKIKKFQIKYSGGVPDYALDEVCDSLNINIDILAPFSKKVIKKGRTAKKKARKEFFLDNTYQNHVSVEDPEQVTVSVDEMEDWTLEKNDLYWETPNKEKKRSIYKVRRGDTIYTTETPEEEIEFCSKFSGAGFCYNKHPILKDFIENSIHYTGCINFVPNSGDIIQSRNCSHIDQKKSYAAFKSSKWYEGFLYRPAFFAQTNRIQGIGIYLITDIQYTPEIKLLNDKLGFLNNNNAYPSPFLKWLLDKGVTFRVIGGCWGDRYDFDFPDCMLENGSYAIWAGCCDSCKPDRAANVYDVDPKWLASVEEKVVSYDDKKYQILIPKGHTLYKGHLTSFLVGYSYISTLEQLLQFDNLDCIIRVIGDGIYFRGETPDLVGSFRPKDDYKVGGGDCEAFFSRLNRCKGNETTKSVKAGTGEVSYNTITGIDGLPYTYKVIDNGISKFGFQQYDERPDFLEERGCDLEGLPYIDWDLQNPCLWAGAGGCGKSYTAVKAEWIIDPIFLFPSHDLRQDLLDKYPNIKTMTHARLLHDAKDKDTGRPRWVGCVKGCSVAIIDEASMLNKRAVAEMVRRLRSVGVFSVFLGDLQYQLPPIEGALSREADFSSVVRFLIDYRSSNQKTKDKKQQVRDLMDQGKSMRQIVESVIERYGNTDEYTKEDIIICSQHEFCHEHTEKFKNLKKFRVTECFGKFNTGQILYQEPPTRENSGEGLNCGSVRDMITDKKFELRHGYTIHSVQGKTTEKKLYIDTRKMRCPKMFYTAVSRCRDWDTIVFLK
jgi:hypothetical protein